MTTQPPAPEMPAATEAPAPTTPPAPPSWPPALLPAVARFEAGDFRGARLALDRLLADPATTPIETAAAADLRRRLEIDPAAFVAGAIALGIILLVATTYL
jgi:hypothetical protein